jgi:hypothetical protein
MYVGGGDASERDYLSESRRLVSTHCIFAGLKPYRKLVEDAKSKNQ